MLGNQQEQQITTGLIATKLNAASFPEEDPEDLEYSEEMGVEIQAGEEEDLGNQDNDEEEVLSDQEVDDIVNGNLAMLLPSNRNAFRDTIAGAELNDDEDDQEFAESASSEEEEDDQDAEEHDDAMQEVDEEEVADLVSGTDFLEDSSKLFATTQRFLKGGKQMGEDMVDVTKRIQEIRMMNNGDVVADEE
ncbi:MAG: hypothetical protein SGCHY_004681 [Lobulomycetales sp.]